MLYDVSFALDCERNITKAILNRISEYEIYSFYLGHAFQIGVPFLSPFRKETRPSFSIFKTRFTSLLLYKDFGDARYSGDCFTFVEQLHPGYTRKDAISRVLSDFTLGKLKKQLAYIKNQPSEKNTKLSKTIQYEPCYKTSDVDEKYWGDIGLTEGWRRFFNIHKANNVFVDNINVWTSSEDNPIFVYKIFNKIKAYKPLEPKKGDRFLSNTTRYDVQGWEQLPDINITDTLIITKSLKDVGVLRTLGYLAIAPSSESVLIPVHAMKLLSEKYGIKKFIILYDRDHGGMTGARKMYNAYRGTYSITFKFIGRGFPKDIADFRREFGYKTTLRYLKYLLNYDSNEELMLLPANAA